MNSLVPSSVSPLSPATFDGSAMTQDEMQLQSSLLLRTEWLADAKPLVFPGMSLRFLVKRALDLTGAVVGLLLLTPVMLLIALLIRLDSSGPVLFRQLRRGYRGRLFWVLKFRTMAVDAEQQLQDLENSNESTGGVLFKLRSDPRVTRLGSFLRSSSLDELPQLINVLKGDMSLVGPRPLQLRDSDRLSALNPGGYAHRLQVMPGLTGPWQVSGRSKLGYQRMIQLDLDYAANWSLRRDLGIICKTFLVVLLRWGAY
jgi:lipopolysaccharide/colanic/teichoic acid biosynthesis glycosyltransferase